MLEEVKNTMAIESIPIMEDDDMGIELPVELAIDIPLMVEVGDPVVDMVMDMVVLISMLLIDIEPLSMGRAHS